MVGEINKGKKKKLTGGSRREVSRASIHPASGVGVGDGGNSARLLNVNIVLVPYT